MTAQEWLHVLAILESIDEVPGMPFPDHTRMWKMGDGSIREVTPMQAFQDNPARFLRRADDPTRAAIWAEVERRMAGKRDTP